MIFQVEKVFSLYETDKKYHIIEKTGRILNFCKLNSHLFRHS